MTPFPDFQQYVHVVNQDLSFSITKLCKLTAPFYSCNPSCVSCPFPSIIYFNGSYTETRNSTSLLSQSGLSTFIRGVNFKSNRYHSLKSSNTTYHYVEHDGITHKKEQYMPHPSVKSCLFMSPKKFVIQPYTCK